MRQIFILTFFVGISGLIALAARPGLSLIKLSVSFARSARVRLSRGRDYEGGPAGGAVGGVAGGDSTGGCGVGGCACAIGVP